MNSYLLVLIMALLSTPTMAFENLYFSNDCKLKELPLFTKVKKDIYRDRKNKYFIGYGIDKKNIDANRIAVGNAYAKVKSICKKGHSEVKILNLCSNRSPNLFHSKVILEIEKCKTKTNIPKKILNALSVHKKKRIDLSKSHKKNCLTGKAEGCLNEAFSSLEKSNYKDAKGWFNKGCKAKDEQACFYESLLYKNNEKKIKTMKSQCSNKNSASCYYLALLEMSSGSYNKAYSSMNKLCNATNSRACLMAAYSAKKLNDLKESKLLFTKACNLNEAYACAELSLFEKNNNLKQELLEKSCKLKHHESCFLSSKKYKEKGNNKSYNNYLKKSCKLNYDIACLALATNSMKVGNLELAQKYYQNACLLGHSSACNLLSRILTKHGDFSQARYFLEISCKNQDDNGCNLLGNYYETRKQNLIKAMAHYRQSCNRSNASGCFRIGEIERNRNKNTSSAVKYLTKGCTKGHSGSCFSLGKLYLDKAKQQKKTIFKKKTKHKAISFIKNSCFTGEALACSFLADTIFKETDKKLFWHDQACKLNFGRSCFEYAHQQINKSKYRKDSLKKSCSLSYAKGCFFYGLEFKDQNSLTKSCKLGFKKGCKAKI